MKKLILIVLLVVHSLLSIAQTITVFEKSGTYSDTDIFGAKKYVKPGDSFIIKMVLDEGALDNFIEGEDKPFNLIADANFFTSIAEISYSATASTDVISFGSVAHPNNHTIEQTVNISGQASQDTLEIIDITVTIPNGIAEGAYNLQLSEDFVTGLSSPVTILTVEYKKGDVSVQNLADEYITGNTIKVQKGQIISSKININEPDGYVDYFGVSTEWNIDLTLPSGFDFIYSTESGDLEFKTPTYIEEYFFDIGNSSELINSDGETIHQGLNVTGISNRDQILIENVHVQIPATITEGTYAMQLAHDFIPGESSPIDLLYFEYVAPNLSITIPAEENKPCAGDAGNFTLADIPDGLEYHLVVNGSVVLENEDPKIFVNGDSYDFNLGDVVKVREKFMTVESSPVTITADYFKSVTINAEGNEHLFCPGEPIDFIIDSDCGVGSDYILTYSTDGTTFTQLSPAPNIVSDDDHYTFTYTPKASGTIKVKYNNIIDTYALTILPEYDGYNFKEDYYAFPVVDSVISLKGLSYDSLVPFETDATVELNFKLADNDAPNLAYKQAGVTDYLFYRFDVPYEPYNGDDLTDSLLFDMPGIYKGAGIPNFVKLYFGKYYSSYSKHCYDSSSTAIYIIRDDIFVPETNFCSNDTESYQIEINTDLDDYVSSLETADSVFKFANYSGFDILINGVYNDTSASIETNGIGSIINITPSQWVEDGTEFKIIAKAEIELKTYTTTTCHPQWNKFNDYIAGEIVLYNGYEYVALQNISGSGIILDPLEHEIQSETRAIVPIGDHPIVIYITPGVHDEYWGQLDPCELGEDYTSVFLQAGYANKTFDIFGPQTNGRLTNINDIYCLTDNTIELESNYAIDKITGGGEAIFESNDTWYFIPEKLANEGEYTASKDLTLFYTDDHGCSEDTTFTINIDKKHNIKRNVDLTIEDRYCIVDHDFEISGDYTVLTLSGIGIDTVEEDPWYFNPFVALNGADEYVERELYMEYRDPNGCWYDSTFTVIIDKKYEVQRNVELNLDPLYCPADVQYQLSAKYTIDTLIGNGITKGIIHYNFNPADALGELSNIEFEAELFYTDKNGCKYDTIYAVEVNKYSLVDSNVNITNLDTSYCGVDLKYQLGISNNSITNFNIWGYGIVDSSGTYFYNAGKALDSAQQEILVDTINLYYLDEQKCPYTKKYLVSVDPAFVSAASELLFDTIYCAVNHNFAINNALASHSLMSVNGFGVISSDTGIFYNPQKLYDSVDFSHDDIYTNIDIMDKVIAHFEDIKQCPYKKEYNVHVNGSYSVNLNGELTNINDEYCQFDDSISLIGSLFTDSITGIGVYPNVDSTKWYFDPAHDDIISSHQDVNEQVVFYYRDLNGCPWFTEHEVDVWARPEPDFSFSQLCENDFTVISDSTHLDGEGVINAWEWIFGDLTHLLLEGNANTPIEEGANEGNTVGLYATPEHRYPGPGIYDVTLRVRSDKGCVNQVTDSVIIGGYPEMDFTFEGLLNAFNTEFYNVSTAETFDPIVQSTWDWDDGGEPEQTSGKNDTIHQFDNDGVHQVQLVSETRNGCRDTISKKVPIFEYVTVSSDNIYEQDFEDSDNLGWLSADDFIDNLHSGWIHEEVSGNLQTFPINGGYIWRTGAAADEIFGEDSWVESPGFDISQLDFPVLSVDIYQSVEKGRDGAVLQYTLDDGGNWIVLDDELEDIEEGMNWYNANNIIANPGNQTDGRVGWSEKSNQWQTARFPLDKVQQQVIDSSARAVRFRIAFASDEGNDSTNYDGFAFDNFKLSSRSRVVLMEQFVNTAYDYTVARREERWLDKFVANNPNEVVGINYHNYIGNDYDTLYSVNKPDISARSTEYGAYLSQLTMVDGLHRCIANENTIAEDEAQAYYRMRSLKDQKFDIEVETDFVDGALHVEAYVTKLVDTLIHTEGTEKSVVRMALIQKEMVVNDTVFKNVLVELLPVGIGNVAGIIPADAPKGFRDTIIQSWYPDNITTAGQEYRLVVYVQGIWGVDEVHQVYFEDLDSTLVPYVEVNYVNSTNGEEEEEFYNDNTDDGIGNLQYLKIYPMPTENDFYLDWQQELEFDVNWKLTSMSGQTMLEGKIEKGLSKQLIKTEEIPVGVYLLMLQDDQLKYIEKRMVVIK